MKIEIDEDVLALLRKATYKFLKQNSKDPEFNIIFRALEIADKIALTHELRAKQRPETS
jgi:hypothetical protein